MREFEYTIKDAVGIHARPAGMLVNCAKSFGSRVTLIKGEKSADASRLFAVMGLGVKYGDRITLRAEGADEDAAMEALKKFFEENL